MKNTKKEKQNTHLYKNKYEQKGITLIALIITIIVMLILVGVTISISLQGGLFGYAKKAAKDTEEAKTKEQMLAEGMVCIDGLWYDSMGDYANGIYSENQPDALIKFTHTLEFANPTRVERINLIADYKNYMSYEDYAKPILENLNKTIIDDNERLLEKEKILLEGINWNCLNDGYWNEEGFSSLQDFVDYINENDEPDPEYTDIYNLMSMWYGSGEDDSNETIIDDFMLYYGDYYINPEGYLELENKKYNITITTPEGKEETIYSNNGIPYFAKANGNYTFKAKNADGDIGAITVKINNIIEEKYSNIYTETKPYTDKNEEIAYIPEGFAVGTSNSKNIEIDTIANGLVITDKVDNEGNSIGNEYVWVPVNDETLDRTEWTNNEPTETIDSRYTETLPEDLINSIKTYKGFYIGRYEAGSNTVRTEAGADTLTEVLTKKGLYPYNYVSQTNAISKIAEMYTNKETYGVKAILPYGAMWDETLRFVKDDAHNVTDSTNWGNYQNSKFKFTGKYCTDPTAVAPIYSETDIGTKYYNNKYLLATGASETNKAKNIYDLAGNVSEWIQESFAFSSTSLGARRGGSYEYNGNNKPASYRFPATSNTSVDIGFRSALYIE